MENTSRIIALIDMDCFYCQVEVRLNPSLAGKPVAVIQYTNNQKGGLVAVNYEARAMGVKRGMRAEEALKACPDLNIPSVPSVRGKADLTRYRDAGAEVAEVFCSFCDNVQRASVDEAFLDLTKLVDERIKNGTVSFSVDKLSSTFVVGEEDISKWLKGLLDLDKGSIEYRLAVGAIIVEEIRAEVSIKTGFTCSAGIAWNKILAKLVAGLHKPNNQTVLNPDNLPELYETTALHKVRNLGGKFGEIVAEKLGIKTMGEMYRFSRSELVEKFDERGQWLYEIARGIDTEPVTNRLIAESIGCSKNFRGRSALNSVSAVRHWLGKMAEEVAERLTKDLAENKRRARHLCVSFTQETSMSRSCSLNSYQAEIIAGDAFDVLKKFNKSDGDLWEPPITYLGISTSKFTPEQTSTLRKFLTKKEVMVLAAKEADTLEIDKLPEEESSSPKSEGNSYFLKALKEREKRKQREESKKMVTERIAEPEPGPSTEFLSEICPDCHKKIPIIDFFEHLDYHAALKLNASLNGKLEVKRADPPVKKSEPLPKKRRIIKKMVSPKKSITFYFKPS